MTALRPVESWGVTPVESDEERKLLRRMVLNETCAHPECDKPTESAHHLWPQGTLKSSSWLVRIPGVDRPVQHAVGLCGSGTTGHHGDLEEHRGWVKYEDGAFNWYDKYAQSHGGPTPGPLWELVGPLDPQPGANRSGRKKIQGKKKGETRPYRAQWNVGVPKDERENGADILDELELAVREKLAKEHLSDDAPRYHVVLSAFVKFLQ